MVCVQGGGGWGVEGLVRGASPDYNLTFPTAWNDRKYNRPLCSLHILQPTVNCKLPFTSVKVNINCKLIVCQLYQLQQKITGA